MAYGREINQCACTGNSWWARVAFVLIEPC